MARPRELFNTPAPQAMSLMGQGIADAYANVGRIEGQGMAAMGEGIAKGITSAASAVAGYMKEAKQLESQNKSYENLLKNSLVQNMLFQDKQGPEGVITAKDQASQFIAQTADMKPSEKNMVYNMIVPPAIGQYYKMQQIGAEQQGMFNRAMAAKKPPLDLGGLDMAIDSIWNPKPTGSQAPAAVVPVDQSMQGQDTTQPATDLANFIRRRLGYIPSVIPPALMAEYNASIGR
jgi:hypothetical protein